MKESASILFASAASGNVEVMADFLDEQGFDPIKATSLATLDESIADQHIDVALIDADGFAPDVWSRCEALQRKGIPFFVVSQHGAAASQEGRAQHTERVFEKPLGQKAILRTIDQLLEE